MTEQSLDQRERSADAAVDVDSPEHGLHRVGQDRHLLATVGGILASTEQQVLTDVQLGGDLGEGVGVDDALAQVGEGSFRKIAVAVEDQVGDHPAEYRVTEELEPFVAVVVVGLGNPRAVTHRAAEQLLIAERVTQTLFERAETHASAARALVYVVDGVADGLQVFEVFVLDPESDGAVAEFFLERLDELDQRQRVGLEVVAERLALADRRRVDFQNVGQAIADDLENLVALDRALIHMSLCRHELRCYRTMLSGSPTSYAGSGGTTS